MWKLIIAVLALCALQVYVSDSNADRDLALVSEQADLLAQIESHHTTATSDFADEWLAFYPHPSPQKVAELRVIAEKIKGDTALAVAYTAAEKQRQRDALPFKAVLPIGDPEPGIDVE